MSRIPGTGLKTWGGQYLTGGHYRVARLLARRPRRGQWRSYSTRAKATRALNLIRKFRKEEELKQIDVTATSTIAYTSSGVWQTASRELLNPLSQGTTNETRIGKKVTFKDLLLRIEYNRAATDANGQTWRTVIFYDRKPAGAAPAATDIFETDTFSAPLNRANAGRFAILYDNSFAFDSSQFNEVSKIYLNLKRVNRGDYGLGNSGDITDISKGAIYLWINCSRMDNADSNFTYYSRIKFTDA